MKNYNDIVNENVFSVGNIAKMISILLTSVEAIALINRLSMKIPNNLLEKWFGVNNKYIIFFREFFGKIDINQMNIKRILYLLLKFTKKNNFTNDELLLLLNMVLDLLENCRKYVENEQLNTDNIENDIKDKINTVTEIQNSTDMDLFNKYLKDEINK